jgi:hypothetical protein
MEHMGHRSNLVVKEGGLTTIYREQWGALDLPRRLLRGSEYVREWIRECKPAEAMDDNVFCEGVVLVDFDARYLLVYGGVAIKYVPAVRAEYLCMVRAAWPDWSVAWAPGSVVDVAEYLGISAERLDLKPLVRPSDEEVERPPAFSGKAWVTRVADGVEDFNFDVAAARLLLVGPALLDALERRSPGRMPREENTGGGVLIHLEKKHIAWWMSSGRRPTARELGDVWPGWTIETLTRGLPGQVEASGRDPVAYAFPPEEIAKFLGEALFPVHGSDGRPEAERLHAWRREAGLPPIVNMHLAPIMPGTH